MKAVTAPDTRNLSLWLPGYLALSVIWGSSFLFIKLGVHEMHPLYVTLGRVATGGLFVLAVLLITRGRLPRSAKVWGHLAFVGLVGVTIPFTLFGYGEQRISSALAGIWNATTPLFVLPIAVLVFRTEKLTWRRVAGIVIGFLGVLVVLGVWQGVGGAQLTGQLMCAGAGLCYAIAIPYQRKFLSGLGGEGAESRASRIKRVGTFSSGISVPAGQLLMAFAQLAIVAPLVAGPPPAVASLSGAAIGSVVALGALGTGLAFVLNFRVIRYAGASVSASVTYLIPIVATVIGVSVLGEPLSWRQPAGAAIILAGVAISQGVLRLPLRARRPTPADHPVTADAT